MAKELLEEITIKQQQFVKATEKQLKGQFGDRITNHEAKLASEKALNYAIKNEAKTVQLIVESTDAGVNVMVGSMTVWTCRVF